MSSTTHPRPAVDLRAIQAPVADRLAQVSERLYRIILDDFPLVEDVNHHLMRMKGKLFRPTLVLLSSAVEGRPDPRAVGIAAVIELLHLATLVHDDAIDHSVLRRGMPTINALFSHQVSVIMGDYLYARALREMTRGGPLEWEALKVIGETSSEMTIGEMRQLTVYDALSFNEDDYDSLIRSKTASLLSAACEVGALCGAQTYREPLARYGERLGMAFQVADDLLDYTAVQEETGKPTGLDLKEHKVTLPLIAALRDMPPSARARVERLFALQTPEESDVHEIIGIVSEYGGLEYARRRGDQFAAEAEEALAALPESPVRDSLSDAIGYVMDRRS